MEKTISKLGIGPMSKEIIRAVFSYSQKKKTPLMLIASKNQIDHDTGYVFTTNSFSAYCQNLQKEYKGAMVILCRDHCGPGFNGTTSLADVYRTAETDAEQGFAFLHVDFSRYSKNHKDVLTESKKLIEEILSVDPRMNIEVGTDENDDNNFSSINEVERNIQFFQSFCNPYFYTCKTGSLVKETSQVGVYKQDYVNKVHDIAEKYGVRLKEHNADYLSPKEIALRRGAIAAQNIAPQLGVLQTQITISKAAEYGIDASAFLEKSYSSHKWEKWMYRNTAQNKYLCSLIAGHYNFNSDEYVKIVAAINKKENFTALVEQAVHHRIDNYSLNLS